MRVKSNLPATERPLSLPAKRSSARRVGVLVEQAARLIGDLAELRSLIAQRNEEQRLHCPAPERNDQEIERLRRSIAPRFRAMDRRASRDEVATHIMLLGASFPNQARNELDTFSQIFAAEIAALELSLFEVAGAARQVRLTREFLSIAAMMKGLKAAQRTAAHARNDLRDPPTPQEIEEFKRKHDEWLKANTLVYGWPNRSTKERAEPSADDNEDDKRAPLKPRPLKRADGLRLSDFNFDAASGGEDSNDNNE